MKRIVFTAVLAALAALVYVMPVSAQSSDEEISSVEGREVIECEDRPEEAYMPCFGTDEADYIIGRDEADSIFGFYGADLISGNGGDDTIDGNEDDDEVRGGPGKDQVQTRLGNDTIYGGPGADRIEPGNGKDTVRPGRGNDFVNVADVQFKDNVQCGPGSKDKVWANPEDFVRKDCENVRVF